MYIYPGFFCAEKNQFLVNIFRCVYTVSLQDRLKKSAKSRLPRFVVIVLEEPPPLQRLIKSYLVSFSYRIFTGAFVKLRSIGKFYRKNKPLSYLPCPIIPYFNKLKKNAGYHFVENGRFKKKK